MNQQQLRQAERLYSALYLLSIVFETYSLELSECLNGTDDLPEITRLEKAIENVIQKTDLKEMNHRKVKAIITDHQRLIQVVNNFMKIETH